MKDDWPILAVLGGFGLLIVFFLLLMFWDAQNFYDACTRSGGMLITNKVCIEPDTHVIKVVD